MGEDVTDDQEMADARSAPAAGRPPVTSRSDLEHLGLRLFNQLGFDATTVDRIADEAGISRRTFFRYFESKNDLPWGDFGERLSGLRDDLATAAAGASIGDTITAAVIRFNALPPGEDLWHRQRMALLLGVPALQAHGTLRYREWRRVLAEYVADRRGEQPEDLVPRTIGHLALGTALSAYEQWLTDDSLELSTVLAESFALLRAGLDGLT